jgi:hypothetical protein
LEGNGRGDCGRSRVFVFHQIKIKYMKKYREGSDGAAEAKSTFRIAVAASLLAAILLVVVYLGNNDLNAFMQRAGRFDQVVGVLAFAASGVVVWWAREKDWTGGKTGLVWFVCLLAGFCFSAGFNWDYFGL